MKYIKSKRMEESETEEIPRKIRISTSKKSGLIMPVIRFVKKMRKGKYAEHILIASGIYMAAVLEYLCAEVLEIAGDNAKNHKKKRIIPRHIKMAIAHDDELYELLKHVTIPQGGVAPFIHSVLLTKKNLMRKRQQ